MLQLISQAKNIWMPPELSEADILNIIRDSWANNIADDGEYLIIFKVEPYIDTIYVHRKCAGGIEFSEKKRMVFHDGYKWDRETELIFADRVLDNLRIQYTPIIDEIYKYYSEKHPDWKLRAYHTKPMRLLDHIYHCMIRGTAKEMLYKAGLDELAAHVDDLDELNLLSSKPSDIYGGVTMRTLRSLNCCEGAELLATSDKRVFLKRLQLKFPEIFKEKMNDAQCRYLSLLIEGELSVDETGRLFKAKQDYLKLLWASDQYRLFIWKEKYYSDLKKKKRELQKIGAIDPIYKNYIKKIKHGKQIETDKKIHALKYYLLLQRDNFDTKIRQSNRKRNQEWQERDKGYIVRYPQTINDFCREAIYMSNCLMTYVEAYIENSTTILFMRETENYNVPFITVEIFNNELTQAYHRFNEDCTPEEKQWIFEYCGRHGIDNYRFKENSFIGVI